MGGEGGVARISTTDRVIEGMVKWQSRPVEAVYPAIFIDAVIVKIRDGTVANRPIYIAPAVTVEGTLDILGLWADKHGDGEGWKRGAPTSEETPTPETSIPTGAPPNSEIIPSLTLPASSTGERRIPWRKSRTLADAHPLCRGGTDAARSTGSSISHCRDCSVPNTSRRSITL